MRRHAQVERKEPRENGVSEVKRGDIFQKKGGNQCQTLRDIESNTLQRSHWICRLESHQRLLPEQYKWYGKSRIMITEGRKGKERK